MARTMKLLAGVSLVLMLGNSIARAGGSFICQEPGGKRLVYINGKEVSRDPNSKMLLYIDGKDILLGDIHAKATLVVSDDDVRPTPAGVRIGRFDRDGNFTHGPTADGKVLFNYKHPNICPTFRDNRIYSIEGDPLTKQQLVAGLYVLKPEWFKLSDAEVAAQIKDMKEANAEEERRAAADQVAGKWMMLNSHGPVEKTGKGFIDVAARKGDAYPVTFDLTKGEGPLWTGVGVYKVLSGDKCFFVAYGTPKTIGMAVYEIKDGGVLEGKWYPWYIDGDAKNTGTENLKGPDTLDGDFTITEAKSPTTGAAYSGTVTLKPLEDRRLRRLRRKAKPYSVTWNLGGGQDRGNRRSDQELPLRLVGNRRGRQHREIRAPERRDDQRLVQARLNRNGRDAAMIAELKKRKYKLLVVSCQLLVTRRGIFSHLSCLH